MSASIDYLKGRYCHVDGHVHRDSDGTLHNDKFFVVGILPVNSPDFGPNMVRVQDAIDGMFHAVPIDYIQPIT